MAIKMGTSIGIGTNELYMPNTGMISAAANGVASGLAGIIPVMQDIEDANRKSREVTSVGSPGSGAYQEWMKNLTNAASSYIDAQSGTRYLAGVAKYDAAKVGEQYAQLQIGLARADMLKNYAAQAALTPYKNNIANSESFASKMMAIAALRARPEYADTSAAYKNDITRQREALGSGVGLKGTAGQLDLDGNPATYQSLITKILNEQEDRDVRANAVASLILLSRQAEDGIADSELRRLVPGDIVDFANQKVSFLNRFGIDASNMGYLSKQGQDILDGDVSDGEATLAVLGYKLDDAGQLRTADGTLVTASSGEGAANGENAGQAVRDDVKQLANSVLLARGRRDRMKSLVDAIEGRDYTVVKDTMDSGAVNYLRSISSAVAARAASGRPIKDRYGFELNPGDVMADAQSLHGSLVSAVDLQHDPKRLAKDVTNMLCPGVKLDAAPLPLNTLLVESNTDTVRRKLEKYVNDNNSEFGDRNGIEGATVTLEAVSQVPEMANKLAGMMIAERIIEKMPEVKRALVGVANLDNQDMVAEARKELGVKIGNRLNEILKDKNGNLNPAFHLTEEGYVSWDMVGSGEAGAENFGAAIPSLIATPIQEVAKGLAVRSAARLHSLAEDVGVPVTGNELRTALMYYARISEKYKLNPGEERATARRRTPTTDEFYWDAKGDMAGRSSVMVDPRKTDKVTADKLSAVDDGTAVAYSTKKGGDAGLVTTYYTVPRGTVPVAYRKGETYGDGVLGVGFLWINGGGSRTAEENKLRALHLTPFNGLGDASLDSCIAGDLAAYYHENGLDSGVTLYADGRVVDVDIDKLLTAKQIRDGNDFCSAVFGAPAKLDGPAAKIMTKCFPMTAEGKKATNSLAFGDTGALGMAKFRLDSVDGRDTARALVDKVYAYVNAKDENGGFLHDELTPAQQMYLQQVVISTMLSTLGVGDELSSRGLFGPHKYTQDEISWLIKAVRNAYSVYGHPSEEFMRLIGFTSDWDSSEKIRDSNFWSGRAALIHNNKRGVRVGSALYVEIARHMGSMFFPDSKEYVSPLTAVDLAKRTNDAGVAPVKEAKTITVTPGEVPSDFKASGVLGATGAPPAQGATATGTPVGNVPTTPEVTTVKATPKQANGQSGEQ